MDVNFFPFKFVDALNSIHLGSMGPRLRNSALECAAEEVGMMDGGTSGMGEAPRQSGNQDICKPGDVCTSHADPAASSSACQISCFTWQRVSFPLIALAVITTLSCKVRSCRGEGKEVKKTVITKLTISHAGLDTTCDPGAG